MINIYDKKYIEILTNILETGYYSGNRTNTNTLKLPHQIMQFNLEKEFPLLTTKRVATGSLIKELLWIFKDQSNSVKDLQAQNVHIWDEWEKEDGTIGTSYGWIVKKFSQIDKLIDALKNNPQDRRMMINLWQIPYLDGGSLPPCCFLTLWDVTDGRLNCMLVQRSGDMGLGVPFNTTQYAVLVHLLAQVTGHKPGLFTHVINNAHIYDNQVEPIKKQIEEYKNLQRVEELLKKSTSEKIIADNPNDQQYVDVLTSTPKLWLNPAIKDFYDFTPNDIKIQGYVSLGAIKMDVVV